MVVVNMKITGSYENLQVNMGNLLHFEWADQRKHCANIYGTPFATKFRQNVIGVCIQYKIDF